MTYENKISQIPYVYVSEVNILYQSMFCCKKSSTTVILAHDIHDIDCKGQCCKGDDRIDRCEKRLKHYRERTSPDSLAEGNYPLSQAFQLTCEIRKLKKNNTEMKSELKALIKKPRQFTVDLLEACESSKDVAVVFDCLDKDDPSHKKLDQKKIVKTLRAAIVAKHKEVRTFVMKKNDYDNYMVLHYIL